MDTVMDIVMEEKNMNLAIEDFVEDLEIKGEYYLDKDSLKNKIKEFIIDNLPSYKISSKNRCIYCKVDMGECNPRQLCYKTYCPNQELEID